MAKKTNWEILSSQDKRDQARYRDVYGRQQLERGELQKPISPIPRRIVAVLAGLLGFILTWMIGSAILFGLFKMNGTASVLGKIPKGVEIGQVQIGAKSAGFYDMKGQLYTYVIEDGEVTPNGLIPKYFALDEKGRKIGKGYDTLAEVPVPDWFSMKQQATVDAYARAKTSGSFDEAKMRAQAELDAKKNAFDYWLYSFDWMKLLVASAVGLGLFALLHEILMRNLKAQNLLSDVSDINQYDNDQHIQLPEEVMSMYDWFPDVGAHSSVSPSSLISHIALENKGIKKIDVAKRYDKDTTDRDGDTVYAGDYMTHENGELIFESLPMFDKAFGEALFDSASTLDDPVYRKFYDATKVPYNPGNKNLDKLRGYDRVDELINKDWEFPYYEPQRPAGAYIVDTAPVNTMVLAITRAGKGQTIIEAMLDMWSREKTQHNMVINDPKGELLVKFYTRMTVRGLEVIQFNLINPMKTMIYNPLGLAAQAARAGDMTQTASYVTNIADVFFPLDGGEDPLWPSAANNAFKRAAYGLIDFYLEEEKELRHKAKLLGWNAKVVEQKVDALWGRVTLYNCYQLFVQLSSKKQRNPMTIFQEKDKAGQYIAMDNEAYNQMVDEYQFLSEKCWENKPEIDLLTLYFNATNNLPRNGIRTLVNNADSSLRAMGAAEKMLASVY